jgi:hypothetical protein
MNLGIIVQSMDAWRKLASIDTRPKIAYQILRYTKLITSEFEIIEDQRVALLRDITGKREGDVKIEVDTPEWHEYARRFGEILAIESELELLDINFEEAITALENTKEVLSISDLAVLEPFFKSS